MASGGGRVCSSSMDSVVRGHHIYKATWTPVLVEDLPVLREPGNIQFLLLLVPFTNPTWINLKHTSSHFFALVFRTFHSFKLVGHIVASFPL